MVEGVRVGRTSDVSGYQLRVTAGVSIMPLWLFADGHYLLCTATPCIIRQVLFMITYGGRKGLFGFVL
jgi:hypothetical protein